MRKLRAKNEKKGRPRVLLVTRPRQPIVMSQRAPSLALAALRMKPIDRQPQDVDAIMAVVGQWPDFNKFVRTEPEKREVCSRMMCQDYDANELVIKEGDEPDGWYLVFSGHCSVFVRSNNDISRDIDPATLSNLRRAFGPESDFTKIAEKGPTEEFGSTALTNNDVRNATLVADVKSTILRVDPHVYREIIAWFAKQQLKRQADLILHVKELACLKQTKGAVMRLAENMESMKIEPGTIIDDSFFGIEEEEEMSFYIIEEGSLVTHRVVDFSGYKPRDGVTVRIPKGVKNVSVETLGPNRIFVDPAMRMYVKYPFTLLVAEAAVIWRLKWKDMLSMLLTTQLETFFGIIKVQPTDQEVMDMWVERQEAIQWKSFKHQCVKEVRKYIKAEREVENREWPMRKSCIPKALKEHVPSLPMSHTHSHW